MNAVFPPLPSLRRRCLSRVMALMAACLCVTPVAIVHAQQPPASAAPLMRQTFASGQTEGWVTIGDGVRMQSVASAPMPPGGGSALKFDYTLEKGKTGILALPVTGGKLAGAMSFRFHVRADYAASLALVLQEKGGGRYVATFTVPKDTWQTVELDVPDFVLSRGKNDPADPDNRLDVDQVESVALTDLYTFFIQSADSKLTDAIEIPTGPHTLYLAQFSVNDPHRDSELRQPPRQGAPRPLDAVRHPQPDWLLLGGGSTRTLRVVREAPLEGPGLRLDYRIAAGKAASILKPLQPNALNGRADITFNAASKRATSLIVQVEMDGGDGGKFQTTVYIPAGLNGTTPFSIDIADLKPAADTNNPVFKLDLARVTQILFIDATGLTENPDMPVDNTLYISTLRASR